MALSREYDGLTRDEIVMMARIAEEAERYEDMAEYMRRVTEMSGTLDHEEREMLSMAYRNCVAHLRNALRNVSAFEVQQKNEEARVPVRGYKEEIEDRIRMKCKEVLAMVPELRDNCKKNVEAKVFYLKMLADYNRYLAELDGRGSPSADAAAVAYETAMAAAKHLMPGLPIRLQLALNYSVFLHEVQQKPEEAVKVAFVAVDAAGQMEGLSEGQQRDSQPIIMLIKDNLALWMGDDAIPQSMKGVREVPSPARSITSPASHR
jgi:hypothetical protein